MRKRRGTHKSTIQNIVTFAWQCYGTSMGLDGSGCMARPFAMALPWGCDKGPLQCHGNALTHAMAHHGAPYGLPLWVAVVVL